MILTPEQEGLVEAVQAADAEFLKANYSDASYPYGRYKSRDEFTAARARAIIPLIYTTGRRAGREEAAKACEERQAMRIRLYDENGSSINAFKAVVHGEDASAIRNLSEQEGSRDAG